MTKDAWQSLGLAAFSAATLAGVAWLLVWYPPASPPSGISPQELRAATRVAPEPVQPEAVFLGDSYTQGVGADDPADGFACDTADAMGWECVVNGQSGTGYVNDGSDYSGYEPGFVPYGLRVNDVVAEQPDVVVVSGGRNDLDGWSVPQISDAAASVIGRLDSRLPDAQLVVVAPFWTDSHPPAELVDLGNELRDIAARHDAVFVDPLAEHWMTDAKSRRLVADDGIHPNDAGHQYLAERLVRDLRRQGLG